MGAMASWDVLRGARVIVDLPEGDADDLIAVGEVLLQEALPVWCLPRSRAGELSGLRAVFGERVVLGLGDLRTPGQVSAAVAAGADFLLGLVGAASLAEAAGEIPIALGALTPSEIAAASDVAGAVQVIPCDALGSMYSRTLPALFAGVPLVASGTMERFIAEMWLEAGAAAVCPRGWIRPELASDPDLSELRRRVQALDFTDLDGSA